MTDGLFVLIHRPGPAWLASTPYHEQPGVERHVEYMAGLFESRRMPLGGPFLDDAGGMVLLEATDLKSAQGIADADPTVRDGLLTVEVHPWRVVFRRGDFDLRESAASPAAGRA
jgi:uncharacterized protein YciI